MKNENKTRSTQKNGRLISGGALSSALVTLLTVAFVVCGIAVSTHGDAGAPTVMYRSLAQQAEGDNAQATDTKTRDLAVSLGEKQKELNKGGSLVPGISSEPGLPGYDEEASQAAAAEAEKAAEEKKASNRTMFAALLTANADPDYTGLSVVEALSQIQQAQVISAQEGMYTITWLNGDGGTLKVESVAAGVTPEYTGDTPTKTATAEYTYEFNNTWEPSPVAVTGDETYTPQFTETKITYPITWKNYDGSTLETTEVAYGEIPVYTGSTPTKPSDAGNNYTFSYWDPNPEEVTGPTTYTAQFTAAPVELLIQDKNTKVAIAGAKFVLVNSAGVEVWKSDATSANGILSIPRVSHETVDGGGAEFAANSTYTLKQTETDAVHYLPEGNWTLKVGADGAFTIATNSAAGDFSTWRAEGPFGIRIYLYNVNASKITYNYHYPEGVSGQPDNVEKRLDFLAYDGQYTVDVDDPVLANYEFAGWDVDGTGTMAKKGTVLTLDTVNVPEHKLTAQWRIPLNIEAFSYAVDSATATPIDGSAKSFVIDNERSLTYSSMSAFCLAYGEQNQAVQQYNGSTEYGFMYATITKSDGSSTRVAQIRYDAGVHAWQYTTVAGGTWTNVALGDKLSLYYASQLVRLKWVKQNDDGTFEALDASRFPGKSAAIGADWQSTDDFIEAADKPVVQGSSYYISLGFGDSDVSSVDGLAKSGLESFSLKVNENGFLFRQGDSGDGESVAGDTVYLVYSETPPDGSVYLDIDNQTPYAYQVNSIKRGSTDVLAQGTVVRMGETLHVLNPQDTVSPAQTAQLVLLRSGESPFVVSGGYGSDVPVGTVMSAAVEGSNSISRTTLTKESESDSSLDDTSDVTKGTLETASGKVVVSFDTSLTDLTVNKEWSEDSFPDGYNVDLLLYENGKKCTVAGSAENGVYTMTPDDDWSIVVPNLPTRLKYSVTEYAVRETTGDKADKTTDFTATSDTSVDNVITVKNVRSNFVCQVGEEKFKTVAAAVEYIKSKEMKSATIEMIDNHIMAETAAVTIPSGYNITLTTASGKDRMTITRGFVGTTDMFLVQGTLRIENVNLVGKLGDAYMAKDGNGGLVHVDENATLVAGKDSAFGGGRATNGSAIYVEAGGTAKLAGALISGNQSVSGGAVGVADKTSRVLVTGNTRVINNRDGDDRNQRNICLDQDSNEVIRVVEGGLASTAQVGVYVPDGTSSAQYNGHGAPAKPFATFEAGADVNLNKFENDRFSGGDSNVSKHGYVSSILNNTVVWGETFSFTVDVQWLDDEFGVINTPSGAEVTLRLNGGNVTPAESVKTEVTLSESAGGTMKYMFIGLAKYDGSGNPYQYYISETKKPDDYKQVVFDGDKATSRNKLTFEDAAANSETVTATVSNYYRYTEFTLIKKVEPDDQALTAKFEIYGVAKDTTDKVDLSNSTIRYGDVGGVHDLPTALRGGTSDAGDGKFYTTGANRWYVKVGGNAVLFHRYYDCSIDSVSESDAPIGAQASDPYVVGDVMRVNNSGECRIVANDGKWAKLNITASVKYLSFSRQDGNDGVESAGGLDRGMSCKLTVSGSGDNPITYTYEKAGNDRLSSDYYYYAVETNITESGENSRGSIDGTHEIVATYDPVYSYDPATKTQTVTNKRQDYLSVDKVWSADAVNMGDCVFEVYKVADSGGLKANLSDTNKLKELVQGGVQSGWEGVDKFTLPEKDTNSWVHVLKDNGKAIPNNSDAVYIVLEKSAGGMDIAHPDVTDSSVQVDAVYTYDAHVNQLTVQNMSDVLCKIVDSSGEHPFRTLNDALDYGRTRDTNAGPNNEFTIEMLRDYSIPANDIMQLRATEKITLTTASTTEGDYKYKGKEDVTKATVTRKSGNRAPFVIVEGESLKSDETSFTLRNIAFDGADGQIGGQVNKVAYSNGGFVYAKNATVQLEGNSLTDGVEMRNQSASNGGAIYADQSTVTVSWAAFENLSATDTNGSADRGGGAIWTNGPTVTTVSNSTFTKCTTKRNGGGIASMNDSGQQTVIKDCKFDGCEADVGGAGAYIRNLVATVTDSKADPKADPPTFTFTNCVAGYRGGGIFHDNMKTGATTNVSGCSFKNCKTLYGGDGQGDRYGGGGVNTNADVLNISDSTFTDCVAHVRGGGLVHLNLDAAQSNVIKCTFNNCESEVSGGGAMGLATLKQYIKGCKVTDCKALTSAGGGLDVVCWDKDKDVTVEDCTFKGCVAGNANGGGICFGGRTLTTRHCTFDTCEATKQHGGAIAVSAGGSMESLNVYGCEFEGCTAPANKGGAIYSNGIVLNLVDDPETNSHTTFTNCTSKSQGGAVWQERNAAGTSALVENCAFKKCESTNDAGGAIRVAATELDITNCTFDACTSLSSGGAVCQSVYNNYLAESHMVVTGSTFNACVASNSSGGAVYTTAQTFVVTGEEGKGTFTDCKAGNSHGGSIYHNCSSEKSSTTVEKCSFKGSEAAHVNGIDSRGGAVCTWATKLSVADSTFENCKSSGTGGALYQGINYSYVNATEATVTGCTFDTCEATYSSGGAVYTNAQTLQLAGVVGTQTFKDCLAGNGHGGSVYHDRNTENSATTVEACSFKNTKAARTDNNSDARGGAVCTWATKLSVNDCTFDQCTALGTSGAVCQAINGSYVNSSEAKVTGTTFAHCESERASTGALYSNALTLNVTGEEGKVTFQDCTAGYGHGGAIYHDRNSEKSETTLDQCSFQDCTATRPDNNDDARGGGVCTWATKLSVADSSFENCTSRGTGGSVYQGVNKDYVNISSAVVSGTTFAHSEALKAGAGAVYTNALALDITGEKGVQTFEDCTAGFGHGGAVYHDRGAKESAITLVDCSFKDCTATRTDGKNDARGGAVCTWAQEASIQDGSYVNCTSRGTGGAVCQDVTEDDAIWPDSSFISTRCTFLNCKSTNDAGGAIWADGATFTVTGEKGKATFAICSSASHGGAVYQGRTNVGSTATLDNCSFKLCKINTAATNNMWGGGICAHARELNITDGSFEDCSANYGGGVYSRRADVVMENTTIKNCEATKDGGGLYQNQELTHSVILDGCTLTGNTAAKRGGAVFFYSNGTLTLRNKTSVTGNKLGNTTVENAAGIYLDQGCASASLVLGEDGVESDTLTVYNNTTSAGEQSNVRLIRNGTWKIDRYENKNNVSDMRSNSVILLSNLEKSGYGATGSIGVCNPGPANTRFGMADVPMRTGVEYIVSDIDSQRGMLDPSDQLNHRRIIWYAPPICKITDQFGVRTLEYGDGQIAAFTSLLDAIEVLNNQKAGYLVDDQGVTPPAFQIQMLVPEYRVPSNLPAVLRDVTITTADEGDDEYHYPRNAVSETSTIIRGEKVTGPLITVNSGVSLNVTKVVFDGGNHQEKPLVASSNGGLIYGRAGSTITLSTGAVLQNSAVSSNNNGGAVYVTGGTNPDVPAFIMERNAIIRNCSAGNGGGVYLTGGVLFEMNDAPHIEDCSASRAGGAVYVSSYATMSFSDNPNAVIVHNTITNANGEGAGIYLANNNSKLNLQLAASGAISDNYVLGTDDGSRQNGYDPYSLLRQDIFIGESADPATSITLIGDLDVSAGSIWVWAKHENHYKSEMQFAVIASDGSGQPSFTPRQQTLDAFRNAQDDVATENSSGSYLYGIQGEGVNIIWSYESGSNHVILKKVAEVSGGYNSLQGAVFNVYKGRGSRPYVVRHADGVRETLSGLVSGENGVFWIGDLPDGEYYLEETNVPAGYSSDARWFKMTIDENGVNMSRGYPSRAAASEA